MHEHVAEVKECTGQDESKGFLGRWFFFVVLVGFISSSWIIFMHLCCL